MEPYKDVILSILLTLLTSQSNRKGQSSWQPLQLELGLQCAAYLLAILPTPIMQEVCSYNGSLYSIIKLVLSWVLGDANKRCLPIGVLNIGHTCVWDVSCYNVK